MTKYNYFAQGEIYASQVSQDKAIGDTTLSDLPEGLVPAALERNRDGHWIVSHSEKGNHHLLDGDVILLEHPKLPDVLYAIVENPSARLWQDATIPHDDQVLRQGITRLAIGREHDPFTGQARRVAD